MTQQRLHILKIILAVILILALPSMFFQYIGDEPLKVKGNTAKTIALVNEDDGYKDKEVDFTGDGDMGGVALKAIKEDHNDYNWDTVGRGEAVRGLKNDKYDAYIVIPSQFSSRVFTYKDTQPEQAEIEYHIQDNLNAVNREKVLRKIEEANKKMNNTVSTLYWSFVSQKVDKVRNNFKQILDKEIKFKDTMYTFYQPGSKDLAGELNEQKKMLAELQSTMNEANANSPERSKQIKQIGQNLASFVSAVEKYKAYQQEQKATLMQIQEASQTAIQDGMLKISQVQDLTQAQINGKANDLLTGINGVQEMLKQNSQTMGDLTSVRQDQVDRQQKSIMAIQSSVIDEYKIKSEEASIDDLEKQLIPLREKLKTPSEPPVITVPGEDNTDSGAPADPAFLKPEAKNSAADTDNQKKDLSAINDQINGLKDLAGTIPEANSSEAQNLIEGLTDLSKKVQSAAQSLDGNAEDDKNWKEEYDKLAAEYEKVFAENKNLITQNKELIKKNMELQNKIQFPSGDLSSMIEKIKAEEKGILESTLISEERKKNLEPSFHSEILSNNLNDLLQYYSYITRYTAILEGMKKSEDPVKESVLNNPYLSEQLTSVLAVNTEEKQMWDELQGELDSTSNDMKAFNRSLKTFMDDYQGNVQDQQQYINTELNAIQDHASKLSDQLMQPEEITIGSTPDGSTDGVSVLSMNQQVGQELQNMDQLVASLSDRQSNVIGHTDELQKKVGSVQQEADTLNNKWAANVLATKKMKNATQSLLGNTMVDGQPNDYVYSYLADPLTANADIPAQKTKAVPPVVILVIILISSLMIGYFSQYFMNAPMLIKGSLFGLLNLIVGLMIGLFGLNIYTLSDDRAIQWTVFTIVLLLAASTLVRTAFILGSFTGWIASMGLILFFISPLLGMALPNFNYSDPISAVYLSIQIDPENQFTEATLILLAITIVLGAIPFAANAIKRRSLKQQNETAHEA
ncbi:type VII secretion protein EsaA [Metabacillus sp. RGM 3146]|uniref:type VII secretion protein EsaA n=1 Tax=Metabacillus sp. RGM 3146 TaxID=3401092 RepID=UPI003B9D93A9